jgi:hypothetical protein
VVKTGGAFLDLTTCGEPVFFDEEHVWDRSFHVLAGGIYSVKLPKGALAISGVKALGKFPEAGELFLHGLNKNLSGKVYRLKSGAWTEVEDGVEAAFASRWSDGRILGLTFIEKRGSTERAMENRFTVLDGKPPPRLPEPPPTGPSARCSTAFWPVGMSALASGEIFLVGEGCQDSILAARWAPGATKPVVDALPDSSKAFLLDEPYGKGDVYARSPKEAYAVFNAQGREKSGKDFPGYPYLVRFDGATWTRVAIPTKLGLLSVSGADDGTLFVTAHAMMGDGELWSRAPGKEWTKIALPTTTNGGKTVRYLAIRVRVTGRDVWVLAEQEHSVSDRALLHYELPSAAP